MQSVQTDSNKMSASSIRYFQPPFGPKKEKEVVASIPLSNQWFPNAKMEPGDDLFLTDQAPVEGNIIAIGISHSFALYRVEGDSFIGKEGAVPALPEHSWKFTVIYIVKNL